MTIYRTDTTRWNITRLTFLFAGVLILSALAVFFFFGSLWALGLVGLVGSMQILFALSGYCPFAIFLDRLGVAR